MKVTLIHNPSAGAQGTDREDLERMIRAAGHELRYQNCEESQWVDVLQEEADVVAVAGGDGTVTRVAKALTGRGAAVAVLPAGTANNVARTLDIMDVPLAKLVAGWSTARRVRFDVGSAAGPWGTLRFIEGVGMGLFARALARADKHPILDTMDQAEAKVAYAIQLLKERLEHYPPMPVEATLDGEDVSGSYVLFEAMNTRYVGPNMFLAPKAELGDGCLDVIMVTEADRERFAAYLASWQKGWLRPPELDCRRGRRLRIQWRGFETHIDDEPWPTNGKADVPPEGVIELENPGDWVDFLAPSEPASRSVS
jgi:diacylglycerol kinase (ATP)